MDRTNQRGAGRPGDGRRGAGGEAGYDAGEGRRRQTYGERYVGYGRGYTRDYEQGPSEQRSGYERTSYRGGGPAYGEADRHFGGREAGNRAERPYTRDSYDAFEPYVGRHRDDARDRRYDRDRPYDRDRRDDESYGRTRLSDRHAGAYGDTFDHEYAGARSRRPSPYERFDHPGGPGRQGAYGPGEGARYGEGSMRGQRVAGPERYAGGRDASRAVDRPGGYGGRYGHGGAYGERMYGDRYYGGGYKGQRGGSPRSEAARYGTLGPRKLG